MSMMHGEAPMRQGNDGDGLVGSGSVVRGVHLPDNAVLHTIRGRRAAPEPAPSKRAGEETVKEIAKRMLLKGEPQKKIAEIIGCNISTIRRWQKDGFTNDASSERRSQCGRKTKLNDNVASQIVDWLTKDPTLTQVGLTQKLAEHGIKISQSTACRWLQSIRKAAAQRKASKSSMKTKPPSVTASRVRSVDAEAAEAASTLHAGSAAAAGPPPALHTAPPPASIPATVATHDTGAPTATALPTTATAPAGEEPSAIPGPRSSVPPAAIEAASTTGVNRTASHRDAIYTTAVPSAAESQYQ